MLDAADLVRVIISTCSSAVCCSERKDRRGKGKNFPWGRGEGRGGEGKGGKGREGKGRGGEGREKKAREGKRMVV